MEDLLVPRYKVIADYPGNKCFTIGEIISSNSGLIYCDTNGPKYSDYPHLFRKMDWWEDRKPEEMPEWIKNGDKIYRTKDWQLQGEAMTVQIMIGFKLTRVNLNMYREYLPSSEEEYLSKVPATLSEYLNQNH